MTRESKTLKIVVGGTGEIVKDKYAPALKDQYDLAKNSGLKLKVVFVDQSEYWNRTDARAEDVQERKKFIQKLRGWATYIDKSLLKDQPRYKRLKSDVVIVATPNETHVMIVLAWLTRKNSCKHIFIEKPIDSSLAALELCNIMSYVFPGSRYILLITIWQGFSHCDLDGHSKVCSMRLAVS